MKLYIIILVALFYLATVSKGDEAEDDVSDATANVHVDFNVNGMQALDGKKCRPSKKKCKTNRQCCSGICGRVKEWHSKRGYHWQHFEDECQ